MDLNASQKSVMVDGYNLALPYGTGIKTYTVGLIRALVTLGFRVAVLFDLRVRDRTIGDVLLHDVNLAHPEEPRSRIRMIARLAGCVVGGKARQLSRTGWPLPSPRFKELGSALSNVDAYASPGCFSRAGLWFRSTGTLFRTTARPRVDIWHATSLLPISVTGARFIQTVHDVIPLRLPWACLDDKTYYHKLLRRSTERADLVLCVSEHTKKDLLEITDIHPDRLFVTYQAVPSLPANPWSDVAAIRRKYRIGADTYFLFVGNIEPKKNVGRLIQAYLSIDTEIPLVIVGSRAWLWEQELEPLKHISGSRRYKRNVFVVGHVEREELQVFYKGALCLVFPSLYEGFGLPPVEAMSLGCPVITSSVSSLPEVCGDAALYVDPYNVSDIADKMIQVLNDYHSGGKLRTQLVTRGLLRVQMFSEEAFALRLAEAYSRIG